MEGNPVKRWRRARAKLTGLGDVIAVVAQPVARMIDAAIKTDIEHCGSCARRRETLNRIVPFSDMSERM